MSYADITDSSNPFATSGLSREVRAILAYVQAARAATGADLVCTSTTDHPTYSDSGNLSRHLMEGTDGLGLGVDLRMRTRSVAADFHDRAFNIFIPVETRLHELIYAYPPIGKRADGSTGFYNIRGGKRVAPYAVSSHRDHVHLSVNRGVFLEYQGGVSAPSAPPVPSFPAVPFRMEARVFKFISVVLGSDGHGWAWWDPGFVPAAVGVSRQGPNPAGMTKSGEGVAPRDGYWYQGSPQPSNPTPSVQVADGLVIVSVEGGKPNGVCGVHVWAAPAA